MKRPKTPVVLALLAASALQGQVWVSPVSYSAPVGESGTYSYPDETGAQLTDGVIGVDDWGADLGNGNGYEWVGYISFNPTLTFDLGSPQPLTSVGFHINNFVTGNVGIFGTASLSFSNDGVLWSAPQVFTTSTSDRADTSARFYDMPVSATARYVQASFTDGDMPWQFYSEARFAAVPEPSTWGLLALGGLGMAARAIVRRFRR